jgi:PAS domain S-box-containing protein
MSQLVPLPGTLMIRDLHLPIEEVQEALSAIRAGEVDALVVATGEEQPQVFILRGADQAHRILFETLNEGALTIASDGTLLQANHRAAELFGAPLDRVLGARLCGFVAPGSAGAFAALFAQAGSGPAKAEIALRGARGEAVPVMMSLAALGAGAGGSYTVVLTDLSPLKAAERALRRANDELEARVAARTEELAAVNAMLRSEIAARARLEQELRQQAEKLVEADRRKDEFLSMLAHELRNPMAPILTATENLRHALNDEGALERCRVIIERQARHLSRLVDDLLDVSRITRRAITLRPVEVELGDVIRHAVESSRPLLAARGHRLSVDLPSRPVRLSADPTRFEQVLVNLLNNAAKYTEPGGHVRVSAAVEGGEAVVRVIDTGIGIPEELLGRMFDLFVQGERSLDRSQGGLGIGLTLVKSLVEMHGGRVAAHSDGLGRGSELTVRLPALPGDRASLPPPSGDRDRAPTSAPSTRRRILLVEDNADAAEMLAEMLMLWGHEVSSASDGEEALCVGPSFWPDVVLIDIGLPGMDGYEVARRLRTALPPRDGAGGPLLIGVTGYGQDRDRQAGAAAGFDHYLVKPLEPHVLRGLLDGAAAG